MHIGSFLGLRSRTIRHKIKRLRTKRAHFDSQHASSSPADRILQNRQTSHPPNKIQRDNLPNLPKQRLFNHPFAQPLQQTKHLDKPYREFNIENNGF